MTELQYKEEAWMEEGQNLSLSQNRVGRVQSKGDYDQNKPPRLIRALHDYVEMRVEYTKIFLVWSLLYLSAYFSNPESS